MKLKQWLSQRTTYSLPRWCDGIQLIALVYFVLSMMGWLADVVSWMVGQR